MGFAGPDQAAMQAGNPGRTFGRAAPVRSDSGQSASRRAAFIAPESSAPDPAPALIALPAPRPGLRDHDHPFARRWDGWCRRVETWLSERPLCVDLRTDVGTRAWFGGLALLGAQVALALALRPGFTPVEVGYSFLPASRALGEWHAQAIRPLAQGGVTGRHFASGDLVARLDSVPERPTIDLTAVLGENDDLGRMLQRVGLAAPDAAMVTTMIGHVAPPGTIAPGTRFAMTLGPRAATGEARPLQSLSFRPRYDLDVTVERRGDGLALAQHPIPVDATPLHLVGSVGASLYRAARGAGASPETVQAYLQAIDQYMPFEEIAPTDRFELVVAHKRALDGSTSGEGQDGDLLYAGVVRDGKPLLQVMRWGNDGNFYTPDALAGRAEQGSGLLSAPVSGNITSWFGLRRHPILGYVRLHAGIDFAAPMGSPVYAVSDGVVTYAGWHGGHGNYVRLEHGGGIDTGYGHMSRIAVAPGSHVSRGQVIGYVGSTGLSTGPHLHYELYRGGQPVNPMSVRFVPHHAAPNAGELAAFRARLHQLLTLPSGSGASGPGSGRLAVGGGVPTRS